jgi:hypothetical protein
LFVVGTPASEIAGRPFKANAESYVFLRGRRRLHRGHIAEPLGIAICADNGFVQYFFHADALGLVLMPHAWPIPRVARAIVKEHDIREDVINSAARIWLLRFGASTQTPTEP